MFSKKLTILIKIEAVKPAQKLETSNPLTICEVIKIIIVLITKVNIPILRIFKGKVKTSIMGFKDALRKPIIKLAITNENTPLTVIPFTIKTATPSAIVFIAHLIKKYISEIHKQGVPDF